MISEHALIFEFGGYSGWNAVFCGMMPRGWQTRYTARKLVRSLNLDPSNCHMCIAMPWGMFRIMDRNGRCEPSVRPQ